MKSIHLTIPEPCHQNWNQMLPEDQGKYCLSCQKTVVDFSVMSDREVLNYFHSNTENTCGRFNDQQLNRTLAVPNERSIGKWKYFLQILLPAVFAMHKAKAQGMVSVKLPVFPSQQITDALQGSVGMIAMKKPASETEMTIEGKVVDEKRNPLAGATIKIINNKDVIVVDTSGNFLLKIKRHHSFTISYVGYESRTVTIDDFVKADSNRNGIVDSETRMSGIMIELKVAETTDLAEVVVVGQTYRRKTSGLFKCATKASWLNIFQTTKKEAVKTGVKIFPNPISPGQNFQVQFSVVQKGNYLFEIIDASGKIVQSQIIAINSLQQTVAIDGQRLQQAGIYIIHLSNGEKKMVFSGKMVVQ
ncbi:MAG: carboxypeptidase-like regulatory domain-containing protein [Bacteroidota bacterium]